METSKVKGGFTDPNIGMSKSCVTDPPCASRKVTDKVSVVPGGKVPAISTVNVSCVPVSVTPALLNRLIEVNPLFCSAVTLLNVSGSALVTVAAAVRMMASSRIRIFTTLINV